MNTTKPPPSLPPLSFPLSPPRLKGEHNQTISPSISDSAKEIILQAIATCSTANVIETEDPLKPKVVGNKTEASLLLLSKSNFFGGDNFNIRRANANFGQKGGSRLFPFSSHKKRMSVIVKDDEQQWTLYHKGAGEIVLENCTAYLDSDGSVKPMTHEKKQELLNTIKTFASQALRCVAMSHRPNIDKLVNPTTVTAEECTDICEKEMILDALVGIVDPLRQDVVDAVETCQNAGIFVRMVTGDNLDTANAIARQAGILTKGSFFIDT